MLPTVRSVMGYLSAAFLYHRDTSPLACQEKQLLVVGNAQEERTGRSRNHWLDLQKLPRSSTRLTLRRC